jgi:hypothetical protein
VTEAEWLACEDPVRMIRFLRSKASERKRRLFAVACCRRLWDLFVHESSRAAVETAERLADGKVGEGDRIRAKEAALAPLPKVPDTQGERPGYLRYYVSNTPEYHSALAAVAVLSPAAAFAARSAAQWSAGGPAEKAARCDLLRCIYYFPGRTRPIEQAWLSWNGGVVPTLARSIYDDRAFDRLPLLADALEDAGCTDAEILGHLRSPGPHVRGCWAVDRILRKE